MSTNTEKHIIPDCPDIPTHDHNGLYVRSTECTLKQSNLELKMDMIRDSVTHLKEMVDVKLQSSSVMMKILLSISTVNLLALAGGIIKLLIG